MSAEVVRSYNTPEGSGEEEASRLSSSGAAPSVNCNNSSSMSEITEGERGYPHSADKHAHENPHTHILTLVNKSAHL